MFASILDRAAEQWLPTVGGGGGRGELYCQQLSQRFRLRFRFRFSVRRDYEFVGIMTTPEKGEEVGGLGRQLRPVSCSVLVLVLVLVPVLVCLCLCLGLCQRVLLHCQNLHWNWVQVRVYLAYAALYPPPLPLPPTPTLSVCPATYLIRTINVP